MYKLIRDNYDSIISSDRLEIVVDQERKNLLYASKIDEELDELKLSNFNDIEEYADLIESIYAMAYLRNIPLSTIERTRLEKLHSKGVFKKCLILKE